MLIVQVIIKNAELIKLCCVSIVLTIKTVIMGAQAMDKTPLPRDCMIYEYWMCQFTLLASGYISAIFWSKFFKEIIIITLWWSRGFISKYYAYNQTGIYTFTITTDRIHYHDREMIIKNIKNAYVKILQGWWFCKQIKSISLCNRHHKNTLMQSLYFLPGW